MSVKDDFSSYMTMGGYLCPNQVPPCTVRGCDNQPLFTSEYYIILQRNSQLIDSDIVKYKTLIESCVNSDGYLTRAPGDDSLGNPDNHAGVYAGYAQLAIKVPFKFYWQLLRQPQLYYAHLVNKLSLLSYIFLYPLLIPLEIISAIVILTSCIGTDPGSTDPRILSWCLIQATVNRSFLCRLASKVWYNRLHSTYSNGMNSVAGTYFQPSGLNNNPYSTYWK